MYGVQAYQRNAEGDLERGRSEPCDDAEHAKRKAARMIARAGVIGATAFIVAAEHCDVGSDTSVTIAAFGDVPPEAWDFMAV